MCYVYDPNFKLIDRLIYLDGLDRMFSKTIEGTKNFVANGMRWDMWETG